MLNNVVGTFVIFGLFIFMPFTSANAESNQEVAFKDALKQGDPYDLICLDIMMPQMDGHQALEAIRQIESEHGISGGLDSVKVIMTTVLDDPKNVMKSFREGCEGYVVKPIEKQKLLDEIGKLGLISINVSQE